MRLKTSDNSHTFGVSHGLCQGLNLVTIRLVSTIQKFLHFHSSFPRKSFRDCRCSLLWPERENLLENINFLGCNSEIIVVCVKDRRKTVYEPFCNWVECNPIYLHEAWFEAVYATVASSRKEPSVVVHSKDKSKGKSRPKMTGLLTSHGSKYICGLELIDMAYLRRLRRRRLYFRSHWEQGVFFHPDYIGR
jgi:hypothetical protein